MTFPIPWLSNTPAVILSPATETYQKWMPDCPGSLDQWGCHWSCSHLLCCPESGFAFESPGWGQGHSLATEQVQKADIPLLLHGTRQPWGDIAVFFIIVITLYWTHKCVWQEVMAWFFLRIWASSLWHELLVLDAPEILLASLPLTYCDLGT